MGLRVDDITFLSLLGESMRNGAAIIDATFQKGSEYTVTFNVFDTDDNIRVRISRQAFEVISQLMPFADWSFKVERT